mmetsp:Transcript_18058/g.36021  ORF Transcript_18058/g.36021 Transcript_18058/m.36021 type:complete len:227 (-) Transcript_18058:130-810(-)
MAEGGREEIVAHRKGIVVHHQRHICATLHVFALLRIQAHRVALVQPRPLIAVGAALQAVHERDAVRVRVVVSLPDVREHRGLPPARVTSHVHVRQHRDASGAAEVLQCDGTGAAGAAHPVAAGEDRRRGHVTGTERGDRTAHVVQGGARFRAELAEGQVRKEQQEKRREGGQCRRGAGWVVRGQCHISIGWAGGWILNVKLWGFKREVRCDKIHSDQSTADKVLFV